jgi:hypothetical protein
MQDHKCNGVHQLIQALGGILISRTDTDIFSQDVDSSDEARSCAFAYRLRTSPALQIL